MRAERSLNTLIECGTNFLFKWAINGRSGCIAMSRSHDLCPATCAAGRKPFIERFHYEARKRPFPDHLQAGKRIVEHSGLAQAPSENCGKGFNRMQQAY